MYLDVEGLLLNNPMIIVKYESFVKKLSQILLPNSDLKVALYTKGSTIHEPTSQYGDLNIL